MVWGLVLIAGWVMVVGVARRTSATEKLYLENDGGLTSHHRARLLGETRM